jgi:hypothetical protein
MDAMGLQRQAISIALLMPSTPMIGIKRDQAQQREDMIDTGERSGLRIYVNILYAPSAYGMVSSNQELTLTI